MRSPPTWTKPYIGIPFLPRGRDEDGADCWGLLRLVMHKKYGVDLPWCLDYLSPSDVRAIGEYTAELMGDWTPVERGHERRGDGISLSAPGWPLHVAMVVKPGLMLHVANDSLSCVESYDSIKWQKRILGIYRHKEMA